VLELLSTCCARELPELPGQKEGRGIGSGHRQPVGSGKNRPGRVGME